MCGIAGEIRTDGQTADVAVVARMADRQVSRGPDGSGLWASGPVALGHRRLSIIELSERGAQPMVDAHLGLVAVFNGCIYNHHELRTELRREGYSFFSESDTEVIVKAYHRWGAGCVEHLLGMFAFAVFERDSGRLFLARDRLGIKPLYLAVTSGSLRFASTLPALLAAGDVDTAVDPVALHHYLTFHAVVPEERTMLAGVRRLPPATTLTVEADGGQTAQRYWELHCQEDPSRQAMSARDWEDEILDAVRRAVQRRLVADVPVGVLLSGGLDSSLITALIAAESGTKLSTYSIGFETIGEEEGNEFVWSDLIAQRFSTDHHRLEIETDEVLANLPGVIASMSEPMVSHDVVAFYLLSQRVADDLKVVQSGQGADEVFAGYHWYGPMAQTTGLGVDRYAKVFCDRTHDEVNAALDPAYQLDDDPSRQFLVDQFSRPGATAPVDRALRLDTEVMLVEDPVKRVDNMTMAWGLEARVPFLDHELVELAGRCPSRLKVADGGKGILKAIGRRLLPTGVVDRPKGYFPVPPLVQLQGPYVDLLRDALLDPAATQRGLFNPTEVAHLLESPNELTTLKYNKLWELGVLELWLQAQDL